jgi:phage terminase large subunit
MTTIGERISFDSLCNFTDRQCEAEAAAESYQYTLYGGSRGPGKSYFLRWYGIKKLLKLAKVGIRGAEGGLFCEDYPSLKDRQIGKISTEFPGWLGSLRDSKEFGLAFHLPPAYGNGILKLRNLDDPSKYQSSEFAFILVDELTKNMQSTFDILRGSLRWPGIERPNFVGATNPGSIGHGWVRALWIDHQFPAEMQRIADRFTFVKALPDDNPHLTPDYWDMLETLPPDLARAWRWGDWDVFQGQFFANLRRDTHGFTGDWPAGRIFRAFDYGEAAPSAVYWAVIDEVREVWVYRELYGAGMQYLALKHQIHDLSVDPDGNPEQIIYTVAPPDIFATSKGTGVVGAEIFNSAAAEHGGFNLPVIPADNNRIEGWRYMKQWITRGRLHIHLDNCPHFWRTAPTMIFDETHAEDMDGRGEDHACLIGSTLVDTANGQVPIRELIGTQGLVRTPSGLQEYHSPRLTRTAQPVYTLITDDGRKLTATADHRIMLTDGNWRKLKDLRPGDELLDCKEIN